MYLAAYLLFFYLIIFKQLRSVLIMSLSILENGIIHELSELFS